MEKQQRVVKKPRMANLELLRCIAMMMVVTLHYLGKGNLLGDLTQETMTGAGIAAWVLEGFCLVAVNVYMLISGYFLCESSFKPSRLLRLMLQVWVYSVGIGMLARVFGIVPLGEADTHYFLTLLFPISMNHYWFMTVYVFLYAALPLIGMGVRRMSKNQLKTALLVLLFFFCLLKSILPFRLETDGQGYDVLWYLCVFLTAAYIRRFGFPLLGKKARSLCLYAAGCLGILAEIALLRFGYLKTGSFGLILKISTEYNHLFPFLASVGLFCLFLQIRISGKAAGAVLRIAPYTLGVYLLHENIGVRYAWQAWLGAEAANTPVRVVCYTLLAAVAAFFCGVLAGAIRELLTRGYLGLLLKTAPGKAAGGAIQRLDGVFAAGEKQA